MSAGAAPTATRSARAVALALLLASSIATLEAQGRWRQIGVTSVGNPVLLDPRSVKKQGGIITATIRAKFVKPVNTPRGAITSSRTIAMFDCARRTVAVKENIYFHDEAKNRIYEKRVVGIPGFGTTIVGSLPDVALKHLCAT